MKTKDYLRQMTQMSIKSMKYQFLNQNHMGKKSHLNTLWDIMIMITLDHYV